MNFTFFTVKNRRFKVAEFDYGSVCIRMAKLCDGMSGREISKLGVSWQAAVYASEDGILTEKMVLDRCNIAIHQHKQKVFFYFRFNSVYLIQCRMSFTWICLLLFYRWLGCQNRRN